MVAYFWHAAKLTSSSTSTALLPQRSNAGCESTDDHSSFLVTLVLLLRVVHGFGLMGAQHRLGLTPPSCSKGIRNCFRGRTSPAARILLTITAAKHPLEPASSTQQPANHVVERQTSKLRGPRQSRVRQVSASGPVGGSISGPSSV